MKSITKYIILSTCLIAIVFASCTKNPGEGFIGNKFFYLSNPFTGVKGRVVTSTTLQADGSTYPLQVKLLQVRNRAGQPVDALTKKYEIPIYLGEVLPADSTLTLLAKKLGTGMYSPFGLNEIGGRMELSPATALVDTGTYDFDIEVSNMKGTKTVKSIAKVVLTPAVPTQMVRQVVTTSVPNQEVTFTTQSAFTASIARVAGPNKIIIKFVDKNGTPFNPKTGQVVPSVSVPTALKYEFKQFAPYYAEEKTDTALVYQYPPKTPTFPLYTLNGAYTCFYRIPNTYTDINMNINPEIAFRLYPNDGTAEVNGTFIYTFRMNFVTKK